MPITIQIVSDLHLEFLAQQKSSLAAGTEKFNLLTPSAPILALLGDTCCCASQNDFKVFKLFIDEILPLYEAIIIIAGNHEYYYNQNTPNENLTIKATNDKIKKLCATSKKLHFLNNKVMRVVCGKKTYNIIGSTLWTNIPKDHQTRIEGEMNDFKNICIAEGGKVHNITAKEVTTLHNKNVNYIKKQVAIAEKESARAVVLTHHKPYNDSNYSVTTIDPAYSSDLSTIIKKPIVMWAYGHTHKADDRTINGVRLYSNPAGYPRQKTLFNKSAVVKC